MKNETKYIVALLGLFAAVGVIYFNSDASAVREPDSVVPNARQPEEGASFIGLDRGHTSGLLRSGDAGDTNSTSDLGREGRWFSPPPDIQLVGRPVVDILRDWHGPMWSEIEAKYGVHPMIERINEEAMIGDPIRCLNEGAARRIVELATAKKQSLYRAYATILGDGDVVSSIEDMLLEAVSREEYNPGLLRVHTDSESWRDTVAQVSSDCELLRQMALQCSEEAINAVAKDVEPLSDSVLPNYGHLFFGPFWAPAPLEYDYTNAIHGRHLFLSGGDLEECGMYFFSYSIDLHKDPLVLSSLQALANERAAVQLKIKNYILGLPKDH